MGNISSIAELKNAIQELEVEQAIDGQLLKDQFLLTYESLKPINLLKSTLKEVTSSPFVLDNLFGTLMGMATGNLSRKIVVGASGNIFRKLLGSLLQFSVTNTVASHPDAIKSFAQFILHLFQNRKQPVYTEHSE